VAARGGQRVGPGGRIEGGTAGGRRVVVQDADVLVAGEGANGAAGVGEEGAAVRGEATVVAETVREIDRQAAGQEDGDARLHAGDRGRDRVGGGDRLRARGVQGDAKGVDPVVGGRERVVVAGQSDPVVVGKSRQRVGAGEVDGAAVAAD